jgi:ankyrin repeat protein
MMKLRSKHVHLAASVSLSCSFLPFGVAAAPKQKAAIKKQVLSLRPILERIAKDRDRQNDLITHGDGMAGAEFRELEKRVEIDRAKLLPALKKGANPNETNARGTTVLMVAGIYEDLPLAQEAIRRGAKVDAMNRAGFTALILAISRRKPEVLKLLLKAGAKPDIGDPRGRTALSWAAARGAVECVKALLAAGADPNSRDIDGETVLGAANQSDVAKQHPEIFDVLRAAGAKE